MRKHNREQHEKDLHKLKKVALAKLREQDPDIELHYAFVSEFTEYDEIAVVSLAVWKHNKACDPMDYESGWIEVVMIKPHGLVDTHSIILNNHFCR